RRRRGGDERRRVRPELGDLDRRAEADRLVQHGGLGAVDLAAHPLLDRAVAHPAYALRDLARTVHLSRALGRLAARRRGDAGGSLAQLLREAWHPILRGDSSQPGRRPTRPPGGGHVAATFEGPGDGAPSRRYFFFAFSFSSHFWSGWKYATIARV